MIIMQIPIFELAKKYMYMPGITGSELVMGPSYCGAIVAARRPSRAHDQPTKLNIYFVAATGPKLGKIYKGFGCDVNSSHRAYSVSPSILIYF